MPYILSRGGALIKLGKEGDTNMTIERERREHKKTVTFSDPC